MARLKRLGDLKLDKTVFFLCDMQERFKPAIKYFDDIVKVAKRLTEATRILDIPLVVTEQYPKGLGSTVAELDIKNAVCTVPKTKFSMVVPEVEGHLKTLCDGKVEHVVLFGIETHVCIQQTVIDLLSRGLEVHVVADACSSRSQMDRVFALERFRHMGATVTTSEAILLQLVGDKDHPKFKEVQALIKISAPLSGLTPSL
ncbi:Isochorismatase domain-containing protein 1 [Nucella lapillus]